MPPRKVPDGYDARAKSIAWAIATHAMPATLRPMLRWPLLLGGALLVSAAETPVLDPPFQRIDLAPTATAEVVFVLRAPAQTMVAAVLADCACLRNLTALPARVAADGSLRVVLKASGIRPGVEDITVATSAGNIPAQLLIAGPGTGTGVSVLNTVLEKATHERLALWGIVYDLRGQIRNCGCSRGSLGGAGHLAALPAQANTIAPGVTTHWVLAGDPDGPRPGVGAALAAYSWRVGDRAVAVTADPAPLLAAPGIVAVIPTAPCATNHRRVLRPVLNNGLVVELLLVDSNGQIQDHRVMPVDATLDDDPRLAARFPDRLTSTIDPQADPGGACTACHASAHTVWAGSKHAQALTLLPEADRTDTCVTCHTTPVRDRVLAGGVQCQACHMSTETHVTSQGKLRTGGSVDCRSCHDAKHDPGFQGEKSWATIQHALELRTP